MAQKQIYFDDFDGGSLTDDPSVAVLQFLYGEPEKKLQVALPIATLPRLAGTALTLVTAAHATERIAGTAGFPPEAVEVRHGGDGWTIVSFALGSGEVAFALDDGQVAELELLLRDRLGANRQQG
jgi:hypothetical protein